MNPGSLLSKPTSSRLTLRKPLYIVSNRRGAASIEVYFGILFMARARGLLPFLVGSQDECVDGSENLPFTLGRGIRTSLVGDADSAHVVAFVKPPQHIGRLECRAAPLACISVRLNSERTCCS